MLHLYQSVIFLFLFVVASSADDLNSDTLKFMPLGDEFLIESRQASSKADSAVCEEQLLKMIQNPTDSGVIQMWDSWGKFPSGVLWGHLTSIGNYDECIKTETRLDEQDIHGQYCQLKVPINAAKPRAAEINIMSKLTPTLAIGICVPDTCDSETLTKLLNSELNVLLERLNVTDVTISGCSTGNNFPMEDIDYVAITIFSIFAALLLFSTVYEYTARKLFMHPIPVLTTFAIFPNAKKLFQISTTKSPHSIDCLNGIRVFSMVWVVYGHMYLWTLAMPILNAREILDWLRSPYSMFILGATVSVDSFFFLSGLLLAWLSFKELDKRGSLNIPLMYMHRILRLTPALAIVVLFVVSVYKFFGDGPYWSPVLGVTRNSCRWNWWSTLLYVQNYATPSKMCLGQSWYLAVDMQLYILSPLILIPLWKWGWKFVPVMVVLSLLSIGCVIATFLTNGFSQLLNLIEGDRMRLIYVPAHTRFTPWLIGIGLGYFMYVNREKQFHLSLPVQIGAWLASLATIFAVLFGPLHTTQPGYVSTVLEAAFFESLSRPAWAISLAWIVFACQFGYGGPVNSILSYPLWQPLGRLTYSIYLVHLIVQSINTGNMRSDIHFSDYDTILKFWGAFGMTVLFSIIFVLAFESPIIAIERIIFGSKKNRATQGSDQQLVADNHVEAQNELVSPQVDEDKVMR